MTGCELVALLPPDACATLRARLAAAPFAPYYVADRGRYLVNDTHAEPALFDGLTRLASAVAPARLHAFRWTRHARGDFALVKDDALTPHPPGIDLTLDFSDASAHDDAGLIVYFDANESVAIPQRAGLLAVIDRRRPLQRYERYLPHHFPRELHRLRAWFTHSQSR
jgi:hypothetical protein